MMDYTTRLRDALIGHASHYTINRCSTFWENKTQVLDNLHTKLHWIFRMIWNTWPKGANLFAPKGPWVKVSQLAHLSSSMTLKNWSFINEINCIICVHCVREFAHNPVSPTPFGFHIKRARAYEMQRATHNNRYNTTHNECTYIHIEPIRALLVCIIFAVWRRRQRNAHTAVAYNEKMRHWPALALSLPRDKLATVRTKCDQNRQSRRRFGRTSFQLQRYLIAIWKMTPWWIFMAMIFTESRKFLHCVETCDDLVVFCDLEFRSNWNSQHQLISDFQQTDLFGVEHCSWNC
jgi:hypothetical protein